MKKTAIVYLILGAAMVMIMALGCGVRLLVFINIPSILVTIGLGTLISLASHGPRSFFGAYRTALKESSEVETAEMRKAQEIIKGFGINLMISGWLGCIFGIAAILVFYKEIGGGGFGAGLSLSILTVIYAMVFIIFLVYPFTHYLRAEIAAREPQN